MTLTSKIAHAIHVFDADELPSNIIAKANELIVDTLMVARAGSKASGVSELLAWQRREGGAGESTVWADGTSLPASRAALVNGFMAAALDYDSLNSSVHADCVVLSAALAVAERQGTTGRALLSAYIAGSELVCRMSQAARGAQKGWTHTAVFGVFGAAAATAKLLHLPPEGIQNALGIALSLAAGTQQSNLEQALTKRLQPALAASNGVFAGLAAQAGISGPNEPLEGRFGLWNLYQDADPAALMAVFGEHFALRDTGIKKYPVCAASYAIIEACLALREQYSLVPDDVLACDVTMSPLMHRLVGAPMDLSRDPRVAAQFSASFAVGCSLLHGRVGLAEITPECILDPRLQEIAKRVRTHIGEDFQQELIPAIVRFRTRSHGVLEWRIDTLPGGPDAPLGPADLRAKWRECAAASAKPMPMEQLEALIHSVGRLSGAADIRQFCRSHLA